VTELVPPVLPDYLRPGLRVVFCGTAPGIVSAARGHYYAGPGNAFWRLLVEAGFTPTLLEPGDDSSVGNYGIGLTDLVKNHAQSDDRGLIYDVARLALQVSVHEPQWVAFTSKEAGRAAARYIGERKPTLGAQPWPFAGARVFVLPSPSGRNQGRRAYVGRATRLEWWRELAQLAAEGR
jgi:TDG/mug DNA glycosylase family protein